MARSDIEELVADLVPDVSRLRDGAVDRALDEAVRRYSKDRPRRLVRDCVATGGALLIPPAGWEAESRIVAVEWPVGTIPPTIRRPGDVVPYHQPDATIRLQCRTVPPPGPGDTVRLTFTVAHSADSVPVDDRTAVAALAAATLLEQLAVATAGDTDSTISTDSADHKTASDRYAARARAARKVYDDHLGGGDGGPVRPAGAAAQAQVAGHTGMWRGRGAWS